MIETVNQPPQGALEERPLGPALLRGWRRRCPNCGGGPLLKGYLTVRNTCPSCGETLSHHRADDMPAWATILIVGHLIGPLLLYLEIEYAPPLWVHWAIWPTLSVALVVFLLPRIKGMVVAMQWCWRMHGFGEGS
ncbi:DUF983 domain-containing protein [Rhodobacteraceae bacterium NNCM2]|nr:DUF983 domain-containing protein [Coraliihabitans acroporae]